MVASIPQKQCDGGGRSGHGRMSPVLLATVAVLLQACGGEADESMGQVPRHVAHQINLPVSRQPSSNPGRAEPPANSASSHRWQAWTQQPTAPADDRAYPQARSPWQGPPVGFGLDMAQGQLVWPQPQPQPEPPKFRPWEEEHAKERAAAIPRLVAPYDRPMGSSQHGGQRIWPGHYPGYPLYPSTGMGYAASPGPWGVRGPGVGWPMGMWPSW